MQKKPPLCKGALGEFRLVSIYMTGLGLQKNL